MSNKNSPKSLISEHGFVTIYKNIQTGQNWMCSNVAFKPEMVISPFSAHEICAEPTYLTVQVEDNKHITLEPDYLKNINHSCAPNALFDTTKMQLTCIRDIDAGDEITFFYPSSEWEMTQSFSCHCGSKACLGHIDGAYYLSLATLQKYRLTDYIKRKIKQTADLM